MKTQKYKEYKKFTVLRCKACGRIMDVDIHDDLCEECLAEIFPKREFEDIKELEKYYKA